MNRFIAAIDQGTTSTRCILFDQDGSVKVLAQKEHTQHYPEPGWVEHDPLEVWQRTQEVVREAITKSAVTPGEISAIGITNQRETTVLWDRRSGKPFTNAIVWQDTRTKTICDEFASAGGIDQWRAKVGLPISTYFSGPKIKWLIDNIPGVHSACLKGDALFGTMDTWIIWWLTGGPDRGAHVIDVTNASRTMLMNLSTLDWDEEILHHLGIPRQILPRIVPSSDPEPWGTTGRGGPFDATIPVCGDLGDQQAALVGQACLNSGESKNTYGTGCFMLLNTGNEIIHSQSGLLTTVAYQFSQQPACYALEGSIAISGALVQWLRDNLGLIRSSSEVEDLARTVDDNGGIYFVPAFSGLFAPHWRSDARGVIAGLTRYINKGHLARAVLEATAYQTREVLEAMEKDAGVALSILKADGGMVYNELLMQFQADILNVPVVRPRISETTALGAAYAAGLATGFWQDIEDIKRNWNMDKIWYPHMDPEIREMLYQGWKKALERTLNWVD